MFLNIVVHDGEGSSALKESLESKKLGNFLTVVGLKYCGSFIVSWRKFTALTEEVASVRLCF